MRGLMAMFGMEVGKTAKGAAQAFAWGIMLLGKPKNAMTMIAPNMPHPKTTGFAATPTTIMIIAITIATVIATITAVLCL